MKREIKFRAWYGKEMDYFKLGETNHYPSNVMDFPVMEFTGLNDKNGKDIYDGDRWGKVSGLIINAVVVFHESRWALKWDNGSIGDLYSHVQTKSGEVIGNVYENPYY